MVSFILNTFTNIFNNSRKAGIIISDLKELQLSKLIVYFSGPLVLIHCSPMFDSLGILKKGWERILLLEYSLSKIEYVWWVERG